MSGTSLDGLDLALCTFETQDDQVVFNILKAHTASYEPAWKNRLALAARLSAEDYFALHAEYGSYLADRIGEFLQGVGQRPDAIASHGHTVFHHRRDLVAHAGQDVPVRGDGVFVDDGTVTGEDFGVRS